MPSASTRTVDRALDLLAAVTERSALTLSDAARQTDLAPSTALRLLRSLEGAGLVTRDDDGRYRPGAQLIRLGARAFTREPLVELSGEPMRALAEKTGESVYLAIAGPADTAVYIAIVEGTHSVRHTNWVGRTVPLDGTAVGAVLRGEVEADSVAMIKDTVERDVTALSAPITVQGSPVGALSTLVPTYRCTDELAESCRQALVEATAQIADALSGR
ncbi:IclR family transcriptional regulator [Micrococcus lylae]|uniref:IclR family transcriptional regulator n=1 Tax=Micrococcus TaxID=1269 RepID=UPI000B4E180D|nr:MULTISPECIES: helix-turn-helix domain-containing protein [Micrococcus]MCT2007008.1 helix-turn-helix domain-containing protein [Micrococcus lylae]MCT2071199.1 helix-turn-helix domain-containing protein [Micrococcus lylae]PNL17200.1 transcriptional regulator [Micrococcus sp. FDAARGOS_333]